MFRFPSLVLIRALTSTASNLRLQGTDEAKLMADALMARTNPEKIYPISKRGAHTRKCGRVVRSNRATVSARTKRKHRRAA